MCPVTRSWDRTHCVQISGLIVTAGDSVGNLNETSNRNPFGASPSRPVVI